MEQFIPFQPFLRPQLRTVLGNVDYLQFEGTLRRIDEMLIKSGVELFFVKECNKRIQGGSKPMERKWLERYQRNSICALRSMVLKELMGLPVRELSCRLAESELYRWFCRIPESGAAIRVPSKTTLNDYERRLDENSMRLIINELLLAAATLDDQGNPPWNLKNMIELETVFIDTTCVKCNIHFPVDWVLLRDATRTLMKATLLIREHGLKQRMAAPQDFLKAMNRLCIQMTHCRRQKESKRNRKKILRGMKRLMQTVERHAQRHRELLEKNWKETDWSEGQARQVINRIDGVIALLPQAIKQAHERIIGERQVDSKKKILSLYETDCRVIVRGKAEAEVEFGNTLLFAEQNQGLVVDWKLYEESAPADCRVLPESLERLQKLGKVKSVVADRGFDSAANRAFCEKEGMFNGICPRAPKELSKRMSEELFAQLQTRRAQSEGRIGILKNCFLGRPLRVKGIGHRKIAVAWAVLSHNLWVLARIEQRKKEREEDLALAA